MAGNLVKYIKHKILGGGYKQFSVQECATDSEELIYHQVRASSSCSAPPDLLLVSDRENNLPLRTGMVTTTPSTCTNACPVITSSNNNQKDPHQQQHQQLHKQYSTSYHGCKETNGKNHTKSGGHRLLPDDLQQQPLDNEVQVEAQQSHSSTQRTHHQQRPEEHIRLEEFTCDVSVEGGKSSQPLQFSFTFYDLDGHHGKITKDDIVGIVYTIYESIGKSVVVPHSGSKTINVRLTVSPEDKSSKSSKASKKMTPNSFLLEQPSQKVASGRRLHRYRPRKLIKSDDEDEDSNSDKERATSGPATNINSNGHVKYNRVHKIKGDLHCCQLPTQGQTKSVDVNIHDSIYDQMKKGMTDDTCGDCLAAVEETRNAAVSPIHNNLSGPPHLPNNAKSLANEAYIKHAASARIKLLRKSRKQKYQDCMVQTRQRSLSVGNETTCWNNRHLHKSHHHQHQHELHWEADQQVTNSDVLDGVQLRNPYPFQAENTPMSQKRNSECWKTALNRNDLISIIRESMEKNRLCFQLNDGKPQANVSPIRQQSPPQQLQPTVQNKQAQNQTRQKTKIPMLIANHNNRSSSFANNNDSSTNEHQNSSHSNNANIFPLQSQNISPVYQPQIGPIVSAAQNSIAAPNGQHSKINLCGYDSFLHATICSGGRLNQTSPTHTNSSNNYQPNTMQNYNHSHHQQVATATAAVQPIMSSTFAINPQSVSKQMGSSTIGGPNLIKSSKILRNGAHSQTHAVTGFTSSQNSPQYHGYQRLPSGNKHHLSPLNLLDHHGSDKSQNEKFRSMQMQNYDLYAKLTEKLQQTSLAATNNSRENVQRRNKHHRVLRHRRSNATISHANKVCVPTVASSEYTNLMPFCEDPVDPVEFQNLIAQTSDDESHSQHDEVVVANETTESQNISNVVANTRNNVAEGTLVDLEEDVDAEKQSHAAKHCTNNGIVSVDSKVDETHLEDELEIDDELDEDHLADLEEIVATESGRNSSVSNIEVNEATIANTGANTSATSSLIHRYVHEHIHHHYHHFEEKDE